MLRRKPVINEMEGIFRDGEYRFKGHRKRRNIQEKIHTHIKIIKKYEREDIKTMLKLKSKGVKGEDVLGLGVS